MYALNGNSWRAIRKASEARSDETVVDEIPAEALESIKALDVRLQRNSFLLSCDWTQAADAPLTSTEKQAWATYRQALRDVPQQSGFPDSIDWPTAP
jgi:hypothetical protein